MDIYEMNELIESYIQDLRDIKIRDVSIERKMEALNLLGVDLVKENNTN